MALTVRLLGKQKVEADYKGFKVLTDQPVASGGENSAPSPFDLFLISLGTCAGFFVQRFCNTRQISSEGIEISQSMEDNPETHLVAKVKIEIRVPTSFPEKYREALIKVVDQCTVKRHLAAPPQFEVTTKTI